jgi:hypothetical protein
MTLNQIMSKLRQKGLVTDRQYQEYKESQINAKLTKDEEELLVSILNNCIPKNRW